jgi:hypothetical protein
MSGSEQITCPVGCNAWKLEKQQTADGTYHVRIICGTPGCKNNNAATFDSEIRAIWEVIEADREDVIKNVCNLDL